MRIIDTLIVSEDLVILIDIHNEGHIIDLSSSVQLIHSIGLSSQGHGVLVIDEGEQEIELITYYFDKNIKFREIVKNYCKINDLDEKKILVDYQIKDYK